MPAAARRRATYEDLLAIPDNCVGQIIDGELIVMSRPALEHSQVASGLGMDLGGPFDRGRGGPGGWWILFEPELHFGQDILVPDLAGWRKERLPGAGVPQVGGGKIRAATSTALAMQRTYEDLRNWALRGPVGNRALFLRERETCPLAVMGPVRKKKGTPRASQFASDVLVGLSWYSRRR